MKRDLESLLALAALTSGAYLLAGLGAALIVAGVLILIDCITS